MVECLSGDRWHAKRLLVLRLLLHTDCTIETHSIDPTFMPVRVATITKIHITATDRGTSPSPGRLPYHYGFSYVFKIVRPTLTITITTSIHRELPGFPTQALEQWNPALCAIFRR